MEAAVVGVSGALAGQRFTVGTQPITFGRSAENAVRLTSTLASRVHAELRPEAGGYVLRDLGSANGTWVNGELVAVHELRPGDEITIGDEAFRFETSSAPATLLATPKPGGDQVARPAPVLHVTVTGGGPVGLSLALLLDHMMGSARGDQGL